MPRLMHRCLRLTIRSFMTAGLMGLWIGPAAAVQAQMAEPLAEPTHDPTMQDIPTFTSDVLRLTPALERFQGTDKRSRERQAVADFLNRHGSDWEIRWDRSGERPHLVQGAGFVLLDSKEMSTDILAQRFLNELADVLRIDPADWTLDRRRSHPLGAHGQALEFRRQYLGVPVEGARLFARLNQGRVVQFGSDRVAEVFIDVEPTLAAQDVLPKVLQALGLESRMLRPSAPPHLTILPVQSPQARGEEAAGGYVGSYDHRLTWTLEFEQGPDDAPYRLRLDAHTGELLEVVSTRVHGQAMGAVHTPLASLAIPTPLPRLWVDHDGLQLTDQGGYFEFVEGSAAASLAGELIEVNDDCGAIGLVSSDGQLDFGSSGTDCSAPAVGGPGNTQAARDAYVYLTRGYQSVIERFPFQPWPKPLVAETNQAHLSCEASWDANDGRFSFAQSDDHCTNIGEIPSIVTHELGHAVDSFLGGTAGDGASGEAQADVLAYLQTGDTCIGRGLRPGVPCHNCEVQCTGVRDLAAFTEASPAPIARPSTLTAPDGLSCDRLACPYPGGAPFQGPLGFQAHCESQLASSAALDLDQRLQSLRGSLAGRAAFQDLWFAGLPSFGAAYRRVATADLCQAEDSAVDGCGADNWYSVLLAADDDDGNLANGTPNGCHIWSAFDQHGIACGDSPACFCKDGGGVADAGADVTVCAGESVRLGALGDPVSSFRWLPGGERTPLIDVTPNHTTDYTLSVTNACGTTQDTVTVRVMACDGFVEDFEGGAGGWTSSGSWHPVDGTPCASPSASSGTSAMYFGEDATCSVNEEDTPPRDLISPPIVMGPGMESLLFDSFLAAHPASRRLGRAELAVQVDGETNWTPRWATEISSLAGDVWETSPAISLLAYQGKTVRLRFRFETYALRHEPNKYLGWLVDTIRIVEDHRSENPGAPVVTLIEAPEGPISECECVRCRFLAVDAMGRDVSELLTWTSDLDGRLAAGSRSPLILSPGEHLLTGSVTDYDGLSASLTLGVRIIQDPTRCGTDDWPPAEPRLHCKEDEED